jgi:outer membrane lipoprotein SlyB
MTGDLVRAIRSCRRPVIGALNGTVAGAGAVIATALAEKLSKGPSFALEITKDALKREARFL